MPVDAVRHVRILTADLDPANYLLDDDLVRDLLELHENVIRLAAADALDTIATSETLVSRKIKTQDLQTDGPAVAAELRAQAQRLRAAQAADDARDADEWDGFDVVDIISTGVRRPEHTPNAWGL